MSEKEYTKEKRKQDYVCNSCGKESRVYNDEKTCPKCGAKYWNKPKSEKKLLTLQDLFLETGDEKYFSQMIGYATTLTRNIIVNKLRRSGKFVSDAELEDMTYDTIEKLIEYYRTKPEFHISDSFNGYLQQMVLQPLYEKRKQRRDKTEVSIYATVGKRNSKPITIEEAYLEEKPAIEFSEEHIMNEIQEDLQIKAIMEFIGTIFLKYFNENESLIGAFRRMNMMRLEITTDDEYIKANASDSYKSNKLKTDTDNCYSSLYSFMKEHVVPKNSYVAVEEYYKDMQEFEERKEKEKEEEKYKPATNYNEMIANMSEWGRP